jgi:hypothetical protein
MPDRIRTCNRWDNGQIPVVLHFEEDLRGKKKQNVLKGGPGRIYAIED